MKTIVETSSNLSKYLLADEVTITATASDITVGDPAQLIIADLNSTTVKVTEDVTKGPQDWTSNKYLFAGTTWSANQDWVDPDAEDGGE